MNQRNELALKAAAFAVAAIAIEFAPEDVDSCRAFLARVDWAALHSRVFDAVIDAPANRRPEDAAASEIDAVRAQLLASHPNGSDVN